MQLTVNGELKDFGGHVLDDLFAEVMQEREIDATRGFAIALNGKVVRRPLWQETELQDGDRVEIIRAMAGG